MRSTFLAILALLFISCSDFPAAPEFKFCKFTDNDGNPQCKSIHEFPKSDCEVVGEIVESCKEPEPPSGSALP